MNVSNISSDWKLESWRAIVFYFLVEKTKPIYLQLFKRNRVAWTLKCSDLLSYPKHSLGYVLGQFLKRHQIELMPKAESHDVYHVLTGYTTTMLGEIKMQCFLVGNGKRTFYSVICMLVGVAGYPEYWGEFYQDFLRGRTCLPIHKWQFEHLLKEAFEPMQQLIFKEEIEEEPILFI